MGKREPKVRTWTNPQVIDRAEIDEAWFLVGYQTLQGNGILTGAIGPIRAGSQANVLGHCSDSGKSLVYFLPAQGYCWVDTDRLSAQSAEEIIGGGQ